MTKQRVTLKEIAQKLGVTVTTVSKALKDYPDIGKETKRRVKELAQKLNYVPDNQALALKNQKTNTIGLILPEVVHFFFSNVIRGIMEYAEGKNYRVLITMSDNKLDSEKKQVNLFFRNKVDGVLVSLANETDTIEHFNILKEYNVPMVMFDKIDESYPCHKVVVDDFEGAYTATKHLIEKGCKRIAHISGPQVPSNAIERKRGYVEALKEAGITVEEALVRECVDVVFEEGYGFAKDLLSMNEPPDGIFAVTDQIGVSVLHAAKDLGIEVPKELKVVGFSDSDVAKISIPSLTTIHQPGFEIGETAAKLLIDEIERDESTEGAIEYEKVIIDTYLLERGST